MNKPVNLILEETKQKLSQTINESGLPAFMIELLIKDIYSQVNFLAQRDLEKSKKEYEASLENVKKEG